MNLSMTKTIVETIEMQNNSAKSSIRQPSNDVIPIKKDIDDRREQRVKISYTVIFQPFLINSTTPQIPFSWTNSIKSKITIKLTQVKNNENKTNSIKNRTNNPTIINGTTIVNHNINNIADIAIFLISAPIFCINSIFFQNFLLPIFGNIV